MIDPADTPEERGLRLWDSIMGRFPEGLPGVEIGQALRETEDWLRAPMPCGHPNACLISGKEGTSYCVACVAQDKAVREAVQAERAACIGAIRAVNAESRTPGVRDGLALASAAIHHRHLKDKP